jgi:hypothetical protein
MYYRICIFSFFFPSFPLPPPSLHSRLWNFAMGPALPSLLPVHPGGVWVRWGGRGPPNIYQPNSPKSPPLLLGKQNNKKCVMNMNSIVRWISWSGFFFLFFFLFVFFCTVSSNLMD